MSLRIQRVLVLLFALAAASATCAAQVRKGSWTPGVESHLRGYSSISYWTYRGDDVEIGGGRVSVEFGLPKWRTALNDPASFDKATRGKTWRMGKDKWTTLDTQLRLSFADRSVEPGIYYLGLGRRRDGSWRLVFVDPAAVRTGLLDAWAFVARPAEVPQLFQVPLTHRLSPQSAGQLQITLALQNGRKDRARLTIRWGSHVLESDFGISLASPDFYRKARTNGR